MRMRFVLARTQEIRSLELRQYQEARKLILEYRRSRAAAFRQTVASEDEGSRLRDCVGWFRKTQASVADLHAERMSHVVAACERACRDIQRDTERPRAVLGLS